MRMHKPVRIALTTVTLALGATLAVASTAVASTTTAATPATHLATTAHVIPLNNAGATVTDSYGNEITPDQPNQCFAGYTCLYTDPDYFGEEFRLYKCGTYYLHNWTQYGSIFNDNTGNATAYTLYSPGHIDLTIPSPSSGSGPSGVTQWYSLPDNEVVPCTP